MKGKARIGKTVLFCEKGSAEEKGRGDLSKNRPKSGSKRGRARKRALRRAKNGSVPRKISRNWTQNEERREKNGLRGAKNERYPSKNRRKLNLKRGKARKTEILERKRRGGGETKKWALLLILQCYEVAKWAQMNFSRIFFRRSLAGNGEMPYLCTRNREATLLQERVTL